MPQPPTVHASRRRAPRRSPSSTWARTASASRSAASRATRSSASTPGARRSASAPASTTRAVSRPPRARAALACLARFRERLSGLHPSAVRAVATNTFRVRDQCRDVPAAGGSGARLSDRHHRRPRGSAPHLSRRRARAAAVAGAAPRHRHRRRLDRIHHRPRPDARTPRVAEARLRQHLAALFRRRPAARRGVRRRRDRTRARKSRRSRANSAASTGTKRTRRRVPRWRSRRSSRRTACRPAASRRTVSPACASG